MRRDREARQAPPAQPRAPAAALEDEAGGDANAEIAAEGGGDGADAGAETGPTALSLANAADPDAAPEEPPPLTWFGHVSNVGLAFVTSLLPSWEG